MDVNTIACDAFTSTSTASLSDVQDRQTATTSYEYDVGVELDGTVSVQVREAIGDAAVPQLPPVDASSRRT